MKTLIVKTEKIANKIYNDEQRLKDKIALYKNDKRIIAIRVNVENFAMNKSEITFFVFKQFVNRIEKVYYKVDKELTKKLIASDTKKEFATLVNEHIANIIEVVEKATTTIRETCTMRKRIAKFLYSQTSNKKFIAFEVDDAKQQQEVVEVKSKKKNSQQKNIKMLKVAKKVSKK